MSGRAGGGGAGGGAGGSAQPGWGDPRTGWGAAGSRLPRPGRAADRACACPDGPIPSGGSGGAALDHLVIAAASLDEGRAALEPRLGVALEPGGRHAAFGTHNALLSLGPECYLEVIAIDPEAPPPPPPRRRWFGLDGFTGAPRLVAWVARCADPKALAGRLHPGGGPGGWALHDLGRGDLRWQMVVHESGRSPFDGLFPWLIRWRGQAHPAARLPDRGVRLRALALRHPEAGALARALGPIKEAPLQLGKAPAPALSAELSLPGGGVLRL